MNDHDLDRFVANDILLCVSSLVSTLAEGAHVIEAPRALSSLAEQAFELNTPVDDYAEALLQAGWRRDKDGWWSRASRVGEDVGNATRLRCDSAENACRWDNIEPYRWEIYEHWAVTEWLAAQLEAEGERVDRDFASLCVWGRTNTGQSISCDGVIRRIYARAMAVEPA